MNFFMSLVLLCGVLMTYAVSVEAQIYKKDGFTASSLNEIVATLKAGDILILGENHGFSTHRDQQLDVIHAIQSSGLRVSVGMEFVDWTHQKTLDQFTQGHLSESDFLKAVNWGSPSFDYYREQILSTRWSLGEKTVGINSPRWLTSIVSKKGIEGLSEEQRALLPPQFELGNNLYKKRFYEAMGGHLPPGPAFDRYFTAQSIWDDTMAFTTAEFMKQNQDHVFIIIVGEFHVQYGGGLPDRLKKRLKHMGNIYTLSQVNTDGLSSADLNAQLQPHFEYGPRADWLWSALAKE